MPKMYIFTAFKLSLFGCSICCGLQAYKLMFNVYDHSLIVLSSITKMYLFTFLYCAKVL